MSCQGFSEDWDAKRIDQVGQNGNGGEHYADLGGDSYLKSSINSATPNEWDKASRATIRASRGALDVQVQGNHYKDMKIQPVEFIHANKIPFIEGCAIKYLCRWEKKGGVKDLEKAKHFIELLIELQGKK